MWLKSLWKWDDMLTLSSSIFKCSWEETYLPGESHHRKPLVLANHRDLDFISEATEPANHHPALLLGTHMPCRQYHLNSFSFSKPVCPSPTLQNTQAYTFFNVTHECPGCPLREMRHSRHMLLLQSLIVIKEGCFRDLVQENYSERTSFTSGLAQSKSNNFATNKKHYSASLKKKKKIALVSRETSLHSWGNDGEIWSV